MVVRAKGAQMKSEGAYDCGKYLSTDLKYFIRRVRTTVSGGDLMYLGT